MPVVEIIIYSGFANEYKESLHTSIHSALVNSFKIPQDDYNQIIFEKDDVDFKRSRNKSRAFIIVKINAFKGRTKEAKKNLYVNLVNNLQESNKIDPQDVVVIINDIELINWEIHGGKSGEEANIGFDINV